MDTQDPKLINMVAITLLEVLFHSHYFHRMKCPWLI